jgi:integration host factor subunit alpha
MTLTKEKIVRHLAETVRLRNTKRERQQFLFPELNRLPLPKNRAGRLLDSLFEIIKRALERGDYVRISGFGKFQVKFKWARKGRNPKTGEPIILDSRRVVSFHPSRRLRGYESQENHPHSRGRQRSEK